VHLPEDVVEAWPPGTLVRVVRDGDDALRLTREEST
jgi:hypothetical protein